MKQKTLNVAYFEPYLRGSHQQVAFGYRDHSRHNVQLISLPLHSRWVENYYCGPEFLADYFSKNHKNIDIVVATDLSPYANARVLGAEIGGIGFPFVCLFLEHQLSWPGTQEEKDRFLALPFDNITSVLTSNVSVFQSQYSQDSFLSGAKKIVSDKILDKIVPKCRIVPAGIDFDSLLPRRKKQTDDITTILFNHRLDGDKNCTEFFKAMKLLKDQGYDFRIIITGSSDKKYTDEIRQYKVLLQDRIEHLGWVESRGEYADLLWRSDVVVSTSHQEFFGIAVIEAMFCDCFPILPNRLTYPEIIPAEYHTRHLYTSFDKLVNMLQWGIENKPRLNEMSLSNHVEKYDWKYITPLWDDLLVEAKNLSSNQ